MPGQSLEGLTYMPPFVIGLPSDAEPSPVGNVARAIKTDWSETDHLGRTLSSFAGVAAVQAVGFARLPFILVPQVAIDVLQSTNSALEASVITGLAFCAWCLTVAETINNGMEEHPGAVRAIGDNFPSSVKHFGSALAGLEAWGEKSNDPRRLSLVCDAGGLLLRHARRGLTAVGIGIAPYIGTAGVKGQSKSEIRKLGIKLGVDGGLVVSALSGIAAEIIVIAGHDHPEILRHIEDTAANKKLWYGIAGVLMGGEWLKNKLKDRRMSADEQTPVS